MVQNAPSHQLRSSLFLQITYPFSIGIKSHNLTYLKLKFDSSNISCVCGGCGGGGGGVGWGGGGGGRRRVGVALFNLKWFN